MRYMLDTNILIYLIKNKPPLVAERVNALGSSADLCMSFFTFAELRMGAERSTRKPDVLRRLDALTRRVPVRYGVDRFICEHYAQQFTRLRAAGTPLGACRTWGVDSENRPQRGQFLPDLQAHSPAMGQKDGEKWTAAVDLQPTIPKSDRLLGANDLWIACHALADDCTLVTNNLREFERVAGLRLENWASDFAPPLGA